MKLSFLNSSSAPILASLHQRPSAGGAPITGKENYEGAAMEGANGGGGAAPRRKRGGTKEGGGVAAKEGKRGEEVAGLGLGAPPLSLPLGPAH